MRIAEGALLSHSHGGNCLPLGVPRAEAPHELLRNRSGGNLGISFRRDLGPELIQPPCHMNVDHVEQKWGLDRDEPVENPWVLLQKSRIWARGRGTRCS